jgi:phage gp16-like protein
VSSKPLRSTNKRNDGKFRNAKLAKVHIARKDLGIDKDVAEAMILELTRGKKSSAGDLTDAELDRHLEQLAEKGFQAKRKKTVAQYPGRPRNIDRGERAAQLQKIEALLTIGKKEWSYADSIARNMKLADKVEWVDTMDLYKVITALRKQAIREGWDLSGEKTWGK